MAQRFQRALHSAVILHERHAHMPFAQSAERAAGGYEQAAFAEQIRSKGCTVRCEREMGPSAPVRCRTKVRYYDGLRPEEVSL